MLRSVARFLLRPRFEKLLRVDPESKPAVYLQVFDGADVQNVNYWLELFLSAGIATLGLVLSSPAVVIGAMLVSPLMGPIIGAGLALAAADLYLGIKSAIQLVLSIVLSVLFAGVLVWVLPLDTATPEILARTNPNLLDLGIALFSGLAGSLLVSRSQSGSGGGTSALPGVAIAVALMPPLCTVGFGLGSGFDLHIMGGASLLFLTNLAAIVASAFFVFFVLRMDDPEVSLGIAQPLLERASHDSIYHWLEKRTAISRSFANLGKLRWRVLMLLVVLGAVLVPLSRALSQLTQELVARGAVEEAVKMVSGNDPDAIISRQSYLQTDTIRVSLVLATPVDREKVAEAERSILRRTGREALLNVRRVAGEEEFQRLREGLTNVQPQAAPEDVETIRAELMARIRRPLEELWPETSACLKDFRIAFTKTGVLVTVVYEAESPLDDTTREVLTRGVQAQLGLEKVQVELEGQLPPQ